MDNQIKLSIIKRAKEIFLRNPYYEMCRCIANALWEVTGIACPFSKLEYIFPEFNRDFLEASLNRKQGTYWWYPEEVEPRMKAFDRLIKYYETNN